MKKTTIEMGKTLVVIILSMTLGTACGSKPQSVPTPSQTPIPTIFTPIPATATPVPLTPTLEPLTPTPTSTPVLQPNDYLLTTAELPAELYKSFMYVYLEPDGGITYAIKFFNAASETIRSMDNSITVAAQPYAEVPDMADWAGTRIEDPVLGQNSRAYVNNSLMTFAFFKGNSLVRIMGELTLDEMVNLGKIIETRLPDMLAFSPITFPEQLDQTAFPQYLNSLTLAKLNGGSDELIPTTTFSKSENLCLSMKGIDPLQRFTSAIYDVQEQVYVQKYIPEHSSNCSLILGVYHTGQYELRLSTNDTLVAILPFEIQ